jgi:hypothetical protein
VNWTPFFALLPIGSTTGRGRVGKPNTAPEMGLEPTRPVVSTVLCQNCGSRNTRGFCALWEAKTTSRTSGTRRMTWRPSHATQVPLPSSSSEWCGHWASASVEGVDSASACAASCPRRVSASIRVLPGEVSSSQGTIPIERRGSGVEH